MSVKTALPEIDVERVRTDWLNLIEATLQEVEEWVKYYGWTTTRSETLVQEDILGANNAPFLTIVTKESEEQVIEPIARMVFGADGRLDFYAYPSLYRVMLLHIPRQAPDEWIVRTDSGIDWPGEWNQWTFHDLAQRLLRRPG